MLYSYDGYSDVWRREYEEYDEEGRMLREVVHYSCGYDVANASSLPADFPVEDRWVLEYTYTYESNSCTTLCHSVSASDSGGKTFYSIGGDKDTKTYDEAGNLISVENYDLADNLTSKIEYDIEGNVISNTTY